VISMDLLGIHNSEQLTKTCLELVIHIYSKCLYKPLCLFNLKDTPWILDLVIFQRSSRSTMYPAHAHDSYLRFFQRKAEPMVLRPQSVRNHTHSKVRLKITWILCTRYRIGTCTMSWHQPHKSPKARNINHFNFI
jgi:hypothetical protein